MADSPNKPSETGISSWSARFFTRIVWRGILRRGTPSPDALQGADQVPVDTARTWFLADTPLNRLEEGDAFQHDSYVKTLITAIDDVTPPFTLGLFGAWGVGKTTIINEVQSTLNSRDGETSVRCAIVDVWKFEGDSLRRQILRDFQKELSRLGCLPRGVDVVQRLDTEVAQELSDWQFRVPKILNLLLPLGLSAAGVFAVFGILYTLGLEAVFGTMGTLGLTTIGATFITAVPITAAMLMAEKVGAAAT